MFCNINHETRRLLNILKPKPLTVQKSIKTLLNNSVSYFLLYLKTTYSFRSKQ